MVWEFPFFLFDCQWFTKVYHKVVKSKSPPPGSRRLQSAFPRNPGEESIRAGICEYSRSFAIQMSRGACPEQGIEANKRCSNRFLASFEMTGKVKVRVEGLEMTKSLSCC